MYLPYQKATVQSILNGRMGLEDELCLQCWKVLDASATGRGRRSRAGVKKYGICGGLNREDIKPLIKGIKKVLN